MQAFSLYGRVIAALSCRMNDKFASRIAAELHDIALTLKLIEQALTRPVSAPVAIKRSDTKRPGHSDAA
jgi:hypothetical protein